VILAQPPELEFESEPTSEARPLAPLALLLTKPASDLDVHDSEPLALRLEPEAGATSLAVAPVSEPTGSDVQEPLASDLEPGSKPQAGATQDLHLTRKATMAADCVSEPVVQHEAPADEHLPITGSRDKQMTVTPSFDKRLPWCQVELGGGFYKEIITQYVFKRAYNRNKEMCSWDSSHFNFTGDVKCDCNSDMCYLGAEVVCCFPECKTMMATNCSAVDDAENAWVAICHSHITLITKCSHCKKLCDECLDCRRCETDLVCPECSEAREMGFTPICKLCYDIKAEEDAELELEALEIKLMEENDDLSRINQHVELEKAATPQADYSIVASSPPATIALQNISATAGPPSTILPPPTIQMLTHMKLSKTSASSQSNSLIIIVAASGPSQGGVLLNQTIASVHNASEQLQVETIQKASSAHDVLELSSQTTSSVHDASGLLTSILPPQTTSDIAGFEITPIVQIQSLGSTQQAQVRVVDAIRRSSVFKSATGSLPSILYSIQKSYGGDYEFSDVICCYGNPKTRNEPTQIFIAKGRVYQSKNLIIRDAECLTVILWDVSFILLFEDIFHCKLIII
jgi:hypothetical protein